MTPGRDDDALTWDGDDDPTLDVGTVEPDPAVPDPAVPDPAAPVVLPDGYAAVGKGSETVGSDAEVIAVADTEEAASAPLGNALLVSLGVIGGAFALYTIGWIIGGLRLSGTALFLVSSAGYQFAFWLAVAAPALWFTATLVLTRGSKAWVRIVWLVAGLVLLVPWPFIMTGAVGR